MNERGREPRALRTQIDIFVRGIGNVRVVVFVFVVGRIECEGDRATHIDRTGRQEPPRTNRVFLLAIDEKRYAWLL